MSSKGIVKRSEDFSKWYNELVLKADLAEHSDVRGCMILNLMVMLFGKKSKINWI